jgi:hypothetical protein
VSEAQRWIVENGVVFMFHAQDGLFFERNNETGAVRVMVVPAPHDFSFPIPKERIVFETTLTRDSFASVMATMSARGETAQTWTDALKFLGAIDTPAA